MKITLNIGKFIEDFTRGLSEPEMQKRHGLKDGQFMRVVKALTDEGKITPERVSLRHAELRIRYGAEELPKPGASAVDLSTGLTIHCPSCGAAVRSDADHCVYCRAPFDFTRQGKTIPCPSCLRDTPADGRYCIRCAQPILGRIRQGLELPDRLCPRCERPLRGLNVNGCSVMGCADCEGAFISHETFELIQERALKTAPVASRSASRAGVNTLDAEVKYLRCPECRTFMNRLNFANKSGVLIDNCREHGVWTDPGELDGILDFIARGGLRDQPMEPLIGVHQRRDYGEEHSLSVGRPAGAGGEFPVGRNPPDERIQRSDDSPLDEFIRVIHRLLR